MRQRDEGRYPTQRGVMLAQAGVTLVEMMIVLAVGGLFLGGVVQVFHGAFGAYRHGLQEVRVMQGARSSLTLMIQDVQRAFAAGAPYGIQGVRYRSTTAEHETRQADRLVLITGRGTAGVPGTVKADSTAAQRIRYVLAPAPRRKAFVLQRIVAAADKNEAGRPLPVSEHFQELALRYFDGQAWSDEWQRPELPRALEIAVALQGPGIYARVQRFTTTVAPD